MAKENEEKGKNRTPDGSCAILTRGVVATGKAGSVAVASAVLLVERALALDALGALRGAPVAAVVACRRRASGVRGEDERVKRRRKLGS